MQAQGKGKGTSYVAHRKRSPPAIQDVRLWRENPSRREAARGEVAFALWSERPPNEERCFLPSRGTQTTSQPGRKFECKRLEMDNGTQRTKPRGTMHCIG